MSYLRPESIAEVEAFLGPSRYFEFVDGEPLFLWGYEEGDRYHLEAEVFPDRVEWFCRDRVTGKNWGEEESWEVLPRKVLDLMALLSAGGSPEKSPKAIERLPRRSTSTSPD